MTIRRNRAEALDGAVQDERVEASRPAVDHTRDASGGAEDERVLVVGGTGDVLEAGERRAADRARTRAVDGPRGVDRRPVERVGATRSRDLVDALERERRDVTAGDRAG